LHSSLDEDLAALLTSDPRLTHDPYPFYGRLREERPVHRLGSSVFVSTYAEVKAAYLDTRRLVNKPSETSDPSAALSLLSDAEKQMYDELLDFERGFMSRMDGRDHTRVRSAAQPAFRPRHAAELEETVQQSTNELMDELCGQETPDVIELAYQLPLLVITSVLGAPRTDADLLKGWTDDILGPRQLGGMSVQPERIQRAKRAMLEYRAYVSELIEHGTPQLEESEQLTRDELVASHVLMVHAGHETTTSLIGNGLLALLTHRDQWKLLCDEPSRAPGAVEEVFRYDAPVQIGLRTAAVDLELNGVDIPVGTAVWLLVGSANRDPKAFSSPDDVDINRRPNAHLSLGHGVHFCLGGPLARLQARIVFSTLARRFPGTQLAADPDTLPRTTHFSMRRLISLPVTLSA
jgi:cytochrome P450